MLAPVWAKQRHWVGEFSLDGRVMALVVHAPDGQTGATADLPAMGARGVPLQRFATGDAGIGFVLEGPPGQLMFDGHAESDGWAGEVVLGETRGRFTLVTMQPTSPMNVRRYRGSYAIAPDRVIDIGPMDELGGQLVFLDSKTLRTGPLVALDDARFAAGPTIGTPYPFAIRAEFLSNADGEVIGLRWEEAGEVAQARRIAPHRAEAVTLHNGDVELAGTLLLPRSPGPHPAIVLAHGSGATTRDVGAWNVFFLRQGMAVLSLDKRGTGASGGDWQTSSLDDIAGDWLAGVAWLKARSDIDPHRIGVHGSSQGGWTAPLMASRSRDVAFVIVRAGSGLNMSETMAYEVGWSVREGGIDEAGAIAAEAAARRIFASAAAHAAWPQLEHEIARHRDAAWAAHAWPLNISENGWSRPWIAKNAAYDATAMLPSLQVPVLWFLGDLDHNVPSDASAAALAVAGAGLADFSLVRLPRTGHAFTATDTGRNNELVQQSHMVAGYWDVMAQWLGVRGFVAK